MRAVFRAVVLAIAAGAVPSAVTERPGVVALCVIGCPIAGAASLLVRFAARKHLHHRQRDGHNVRKVIVVGSAYAAADLYAVLQPGVPVAACRSSGSACPRPTSPGRTTPAWP